ncbi:MAG: Protein translocase subunit SecD [Dehalococcoidia bacterium]|nr:Protein translocase subunit SecD [Dehalococcoidia bacterium]
MRRFPLRRSILIAIIVALAGASIAFQQIRLSAGGVTFERGGDSPLGLTLGLDLKGGSHLVYQAQPEEGESVTSEQMDGVIRTIERRVNAFGVTEPVIQRIGGDRVLVQLPGIGVARANVTFLEDVETSALRSVLSDMGRPDTVIDKKGDRTFTLELPSLKAGERELIQQALQKAFPSIVLRLTFLDSVEADAISSVLEGLGRVDATVSEEGANTFTIELPSPKPEELDAEGKVVQPPEENLLHLAFQEKLPSLLSFDVERMSYGVTGGVEEAKRLIGETARLEFKERTCLNDPNDVTQSCEDPRYHLDEDRNLGGDDLARAYAGTQPTTGVPVVNIEFKSAGAKIFAEITKRIAGTDNRLAIFLDDLEIMAPTAKQAITGGQAFIEGPDFTADRVRTIAIQLESGRLPVPLALIQEQDVDATLGKDSLRKSVVAGLIGVGLVILFMTLYYRLPGVLASVALVMYAVMVLGIFKLWPITLSLAGMAALILSVGMAVDANVLIFERMKEELRSGRTLIAAIETGFNRAWPSIRDSNVSTFITCAILFWFGSRLGTGLVTGFAVTLAIGVAVSMFSAITVSRTLLRAIAFTPL